MAGGPRGMNIAAMQSSLHHNENVSGDQPAPTAVGALGEGLAHYIAVWTKANPVKHLTVGLIEDPEGVLLSLLGKPPTKASIMSETDKNMFGLHAVGSLPSEGGGGGDDDGDGGGDAYEDDGHHPIGDEGFGGDNYDNPFPHTSERMGDGEGMSFAGEGETSPQQAPIVHGMDDEYNGRGY